MTQNNDKVLILIYLHDYQNPELFEYTIVPKDVAYLIQKYVLEYTNDTVTLPDIISNLMLNEFSIVIYENREIVEAVILLESFRIYHKSCSLLNILMESMFHKVCGRKLARDMVNSTSTNLKYTLIRTCANYLFP